MIHDNDSVLHKRNTSCLTLLEGKQLKGGQFGSIQATLTKAAFPYFLNRKC